MSDEATMSFLGIPIKGSITSERKTVQHKVSELAPLMQALVDDPSIRSFSWEQYTPYFNDGEPCVFRVNNRLKVNLASDDPESDKEYSCDEGVRYGERLGKRAAYYDSSIRSHVLGAYTGPDEARYDRCLALENALCSGEFDNALLTQFGDHASVTVFSDHIEIDFYDHD